jgi:predicted GTPase
MLYCAGARLRAARLTIAAKAASWTASPGSAVADAAGLHVPAYTIWGANTDVGKTLVSAGLCRALVQSDVRTLALASHDVARMLALQASMRACTCIPCRNSQFCTLDLLL